MVQLVSLVWGILAIIGMVVGFMPCLGALNWLVIPFAVVGLVVSAIAMRRSEGAGKGKAGSKAGLVCCGAAALLGFVRLGFGGGIF